MASTDPNRAEVPRVTAPTPERRWPMSLAVLTAIALQVGTPKRGRVPGWWVFPMIELVLLIVLILRDPGRIDRRTRGMRRATLGLIVFMTIGITTSLVALVVDIIDGVKGVSAGNLLSRGAALWFSNVIVYSLWFWELDRGGPAARGAAHGIRLSFAFPEDAMSELAPPGWIPAYPDYLYLSFTNATAFSPTDTLPVRTAKMVMMFEAAVSLATAILVVARAINVLPR